MANVIDNKTKLITLIIGWPLDISAGSGAAFFTKNFVAQLQRKNIPTKILNLNNTLKNYHIYLLKRILFNLSLRFKSNVAGVVLGFDFDGFFMARNGIYFVALPRGIFGDILAYERGLHRLSVKIQAWLEGINVRKANLVIVPSQYAKKMAVRFYNVDAKKVVIIPNGFDLTEWERMWVKAPENIDHKKKIILAVAKFYPRKRLNILIEAFAQVLLRYQEVELQIVGDGIEFDNLKKLSKSLGIEAAVNFCGCISERAQIVYYYKNCDIFCHPSVQETFGNVLLEAMASSKPIVAARAASIPEIIDEGVNGFLFTPDDSKELADKLVHLLNNEQLCLVLGRGGYNILKNNYLWDKQIQIFLNYLTKPSLCL